MDAKTILESRSYLYLIKVKGQEIYKIGISRDPVSRLFNLQTSCPYKLHFVCCLQVDDAERLEAQLHNCHQSRRLLGEWFEFSDKDVHGVIRLIRLAHSDCLDNVSSTIRKIEVQGRLDEKKNGRFCPKCGGRLESGGIVKSGRHQGLRKLSCRNREHAKQMGAKTYYVEASKWTHQ